MRPRNAEINPAALARYLPHVALLEVRSADDTICRLAGTAIRLSLGFELTGKSVIHLYAPELHRAAGFRFWTMATQPCGATFEIGLRFFRPGPMRRMRSSSCRLNRTAQEWPRPSCWGRPACRR